MGLYCRRCSILLDKRKSAALLVVFLMSPIGIIASLTEHVRLQLHPVHNFCPYDSRAYPAHLAAGEQVRRIICSDLLVRALYDEPTNLATLHRTMLSRP